MHRASSVFRVWLVVLVCVTAGAGYSYFQYRDRPLTLRLPQAALDGARERIVAEGFACAKLKTLKKCSYRRGDASLFACGPDDGTEKVDPTALYISLFDEREPEAPPSRRSGGEEEDKNDRIQPYGGSLAHCPPDPFAEK